MKTSEFNYNLPPELIATSPIEPRDMAKMLIMERNGGKLQDKYFYNLVDILMPGDVLVFNDSKVIPARLHATITRSDLVARFEVLLVKNCEGGTWECWVKPGKKLHVGDVLTFSKKLTAEYLRRKNDIFILKFNLGGSDFFKELEKIGEMPVPPYIVKARRFDEQKTNNKKQITSDEKDYQTVYAKTEGSVAAPTAGLHFTEELLSRLKDKGIQLEYVTLHVGLGTFQPVTAENVEDFQIHSEYYEITPETAQRLNDARKEGRRIIAVGTTTVRVLESAASSVKRSDLIQTRTARGKVGPFEVSTFSGDTSIYIYPGYHFKFVDGMITNFHLPKSSLLLLVSAFSRTEHVLNAYQYAIKKRYKFYSYGDGMFII